VINQKTVLKCQCPLNRHAAKERCHGRKPRFAPASCVSGVGVGGPDPFQQGDDGTAHRQATTHHPRPPRSASCEIVFPCWLSRSLVVVLGCDRATIGLKQGYRFAPSEEPHSSNRLSKIAMSRAIPSTFFDGLSLRLHRRFSAVRFPHLHFIRITVLSCCLMGMRSLVSAQDSSSSSSGGGGGLLVRSGIIGNYMDRDDYEFCLEAMQASDADNDGEISEGEFVDFCRYMAPPFILDGYDTFDALPAPFQDVFSGVACLCDPSGAAGSSCCAGTEAHVRVPDVASVDDLTSEDRLYLYPACSNTKSVAQNYADHANQTTPQSTPLWPVQPPPNSPPSAPQPPPPPSNGTTPPPTRRPTRRPSNAAAPTDRPTRRPANAEGPSASPTEEPAVEIAPTSGPTAAASGPTTTGRPTVAGNETSSFPTESPVREPSSEPSPSPTPLANVVAEATAKVEYFFSVPTSALGDGAGGNSSSSSTAASGGGTTTNASNSDAMVSILSDLQVAMNRLAPQVTIHSDRDVRFEPHRGRYRRHMRKNRRLQALQVLLPTSFGNLAQVGT
jgi:hypothetical protein